MPEISEPVVRVRCSAPCLNSSGVLSGVRQCANPCTNQPQRHLPRYLFVGQLFSRKGLRGRLSAVESPKRVGIFETLSISGERYRFRGPRRTDRSPGAMVRKTNHGTPQRAGQDTRAVQAHTVPDVCTIGETTIRFSRTREDARFSCHATTATTASVTAPASHLVGGISTANISKPNGERSRIRPSTIIATTITKRCPPLARSDSFPAVRVRPWCRLLRGWSFRGSFLAPT